jgi:hypothetical protein
MDLLKCRLLLHNPGFYKEYIIVFTVVPGVPGFYKEYIIVFTVVPGVPDEHGP